MTKKGKIISISRIFRLKLNWNDGNLWKSDKILVEELTDQIFEYKFALVDKDHNVKKWQEG